MKPIATAILTALVVVLSFFAFYGIIVMVQNLTGYDMIHTIVPYQPITTLTTII